MGYRSDVGIAMYEDDFKNLIEETKQHYSEKDKYKDAYLCLTEYCDSYHGGTWYEERAYDPKTGKLNTDKLVHIVILRWYDIKLYSSGMELIQDYIRQHDGAIAWVGEAWDDVGFEDYDERGNGIEWYEFVEPVSYIETGSTADYKNFTAFAQDIDLWD